MEGVYRGDRWGVCCKMEVVVGLFLEISREWGLVGGGCFMLTGGPAHSLGGRNIRLTSE